MQTRRIITCQSQKRESIGAVKLLKTWLQIAVIVLIPLIAFLFFTFNRDLIFLHSLSMVLRTGYTIVIPSVFVILYLTFRIHGWLGELVSLFVTLSIFGLALTGIWASGQTESGILSGVIPMFDSTDYYVDSLRLLAGKEFSEISTRRPLFAAFFAFLLWIANYHLLHALAMLTLLVALACYLLAREINRSHGPVSASFVLVIIFVYYRFHSGAVRTENLGVLFGVLGAALLWRGMSEQYSKYYVLAGIFLTGMGIIARAGAFFILPLLVLWGAILFRREKQIISWQFLFVGLLTIVSAFAVNQLLVKSFGTSGVIPFGNFSYSFYGLAAGGKSWAFVTQAYPEASYLDIYRMAIQLILEQPNLLLKGVIHNYSMFFSDSNYGLFSYMRGEGSLSSTISFWALLFLSVLGIGWPYRGKNVYRGFVAASTIGLLLSVPFLPPTDAFRLRAYAASIPILAILPAIGLQRALIWLRAETKQQNSSDFIYQKSLAWYSVVITAMVILGPYLAKNTAIIPKIEPAMCESELTSVILRYDPGSMVHFVPQNALLLDWAPTFHIGTFRRSVHGFPDFALMDWALENVTNQKTLFYTLDFRSSRNVLVVVDSNLLPPPRAFLELCGKWDDNPDVDQYRIFYVSNLKLITSE